ncbi:hypothetical protein HETIRDRAFT_416444 [Heterobasidion irregulare TC 32-1]|uniref:Uncharacterized protein n=1 Tax=Heterobasidion irregulare (strain TC 32-1) TaxID=747525 RepID=W4KGH8_HETIT|nr:uncharacterized protein HETIRDRAFT_416444 [Heterobasidion irregulare TC 32-1]ETW84804.1 hypothetical protein HETIRDRAFT_416444 [Heterobasidion irregulare TC 32-1]
MIIRHSISIVYLSTKFETILVILEWRYRVDMGPMNQKLGAEEGFVYRPVK